MKNENILFGAVSTPWKSARERLLTSALTTTVKHYTCIGLPIVYKRLTTIIVAEIT